MKSFEQIAKEMTASGQPLCKERVRNIHDGALRKIRSLLQDNPELREDLVEFAHDSGRTDSDHRFIGGRGMGNESS
tara:strand:+ start:226 stop:453 length:228 start_codon:yes stop_codon:yes gene_type:complete